MQLTESITSPPSPRTLRQSRLLHKGARHATGEEDGQTRTTCRPTPVLRGWPRYDRTDITFIRLARPRAARHEQHRPHRLARRRRRSSLRYWLDRFNTLKVTHGGIVDRDARPTIDFEDPEGQRLSPRDGRRPARRRTVGKKPRAAEPPEPRARADHDQRARREADGRGVTKVMKCATRASTPPPPDRRSRWRDDEHRARVRDGRGRPRGRAARRRRAGLPPSFSGAGGVHHVAFRVPTYNEYDQWNERLRGMRVARAARRPLLLPQPLLPRAERHSCSNWQRTAPV